MAIEKLTLAEVIDSLGNIDGASRTKLLRNILRGLADETTQGGWRDLKAPFIAGKLVGLSDPTLVPVGPTGNTKQFKFDIGDEVLFIFHIDHDILEGSTIYPHVHWTTNGTDTNTVKWELNLTMADRLAGTPDIFEAEIQFHLEEAATGTAWSHMVTEDPTGFTTPSVDGVILGHLKRVTNGGTNNTDNIIGLFCDLHYQVYGYATKNRAPDFYT